MTKEAKKGARSGTLTVFPPKDMLKIQGYTARALAAGFEKIEVHHIRPAITS
jgi:hypothetical protein